MVVWNCVKPKTKEWVNFGNGIIMNTSFEMKNPTQRFLITLKTIPQNGKRIRFLQNDYWLKE